MPKNTKKMAVLQRLKQEKVPISSKELLEKLGASYSERSLRRWLSEMVEQGLVEKQGSKRANRYQAIRSISYPKSDAARCFGPDSEKAIEHIRRPLYEREPIAYSDHWFNAYHPNKSFYTPLELRMRLHHAGKRSKVEDPAGTYAH